jgi:hypothetical protein
MHGSFGNSDAVASEIGGRFRPGLDRIVQRRVFGAVCKIVWPENTEAHVAAIGKRDVRTARRWMSGEIAPPSILIAAINNAITWQD